MNAPGRAWSNPGSVLLDANPILLGIAKGELCPECARRAPELHRVHCANCRAEYVRAIARRRSAERAS